MLFIHLFYLTILCLSFLCSDSSSDSTAPVCVSSPSPCHTPLTFLWTFPSLPNSLLVFLSIIICTPALQMDAHSAVTCMCRRQSAAHLQLCDVLGGFWSVIIRHSCFKLQGKVQYSWYSVKSVTSCLCVCWLEGGQEGLVTVSSMSSVICKHTTTLVALRTCTDF